MRAGRFPKKYRCNIWFYERAVFTAVQRIPFPKVMPQELRTFISVTYFDITNHNKKRTPTDVGLMSVFFKNFNPEIVGYCMDAEEDATHNAGNDDIIFWNLLYKIYPELHGFYWKKVYESLQALGCDMLERTV